MRIAERGFCAGGLPSVGQGDAGVVAAGAPESYRVVIARTRTVLASHARMATTLVERMVGLLKHSHLEPGAALIILSCRAIHTCFMRFPIDVVFVSRAWEVVAIRSALPPWRFSPTVWRAVAVVELPAGTVERTQLAAGDHLLVEPVTGP